MYAGLRLHGSTQRFYVSDSRLVAECLFDVYLSYCSLVYKAIHGGQGPMAGIHSPTGDGERSSQGYLLARLAPGLFKADGAGRAESLSGAETRCAESISGYPEVCLE